MRGAAGLAGRAWQLYSTPLEASMALEAYKPRGCFVVGYRVAARFIVVKPRAFENLGERHGSVAASIMLY